jgi:hypothetical protein
VKVLFQIAFFCVGIAVISSCKNELELNAPYKEIPTIYAVLNPQDPTQTIRINKVFLGEGDANVMAKVHDSVNYKPGELTVTLEKVSQRGTNRCLTGTSHNHFWGECRSNCRGGI